jgi:hypothetical protein
MKIALRTKVLLVAAAAVAAYVGFSSNDTETVAARTQSSTTQRARTHAGAVPASEGSRDVMLLARRVADTKAVSALFSAHSWYVPPPPPPSAPAPVLTPAQIAAMQKPVAPPLPFTFMGSYVIDGADPVFFLTQGDRVYDVRVGDLLDNTYSVDSFTNGQLLMTYKPLNMQQQLSAGGSQ